MNDTRRNGDNWVIIQKALAVDNFWKKKYNGKCESGKKLFNFKCHKCHKIEPKPIESKSKKWASIKVKGVSFSTSTEIHA